MEFWEQVVVSSVVLLSGLTVAMYLVKFATRPQEPPECPICAERAHQAAPSSVPPPSA
ncbi:MAG: hypothetical protein GY772_29535 [bacterium]|nr:hypothetical protein [bacterium]